MPHPLPPVIVAATDDGFAFPTAVMAASVATAAPPGRIINLYVLDGGMQAPTAKRLHKALQHTAAQAATRNVRFHPHLIAADPGRFAGLQAHQRITKGAYLRLLVGDLLPEHVERVLYLDGDVIVLRDVASLFEFDLEGAPAAAVPSQGSPTFGHGKRSYAELGIHPSTAYVNSGVLLIDLAQWRTEKLGAAVLDDLRRHRHLYRWCDQDGLNTVLAGRWAPLPTAWNVQTGSKTLRASPPPLDAVAALHFTGVRKPWAPQHAAFFDEPAAYATYYRAWFTRARQCGWYGTAEWAAYRTRLRLHEARARALHRWRSFRFRLGELRARITS